MNNNCSIEDTSECRMINKTEFFLFETAVEMTEMIDVRWKSHLGGLARVSHWFLLERSFSIRPNDGCFDKGKSHYIRGRCDQLQQVSALCANRLSLDTMRYVRIATKELFLNL